MALMKTVMSQEVAIFRHRQLQISERLWVLKGSMFYFVSKCLQEGRKPQKQSKMSQSCAKVALRGKNCALARKREVAQKLRCATSQFSGGLQDAKLNAASLEGVHNRQILMTRIAHYRI